MVQHHPATALEKPGLIHDHHPARMANASITQSRRSTRIASASNTEPDRTRCRPYGVASPAASAKTATRSSGPLSRVILAATVVLERFQDWCTALMKRCRSGLSPTYPAPYLTAEPGPLISPLRDQEGKEYVCKAPISSRKFSFGFPRLSRSALRTVSRCLSNDSEATS
jgi:hypothetical protein